MNKVNLAGRQRVLDADHHDTYTGPYLLAYAYEVAGDLDRAIPLYEATLIDMKRVLGADHPDTLMSRDNLAYARIVTSANREKSVPLGSSPRKSGVTKRGRWRFRR